MIEYIPNGHNKPAPGIALNYTRAFKYLVNKSMKALSPASICIFEDCCKQNDGANK